MTDFIATSIQKARAKSLEEGQAKYRAYFVRLKIYKKWQPEVDKLLKLKGCADCIVTE